MSSSSDSPVKIIKELPDDVILWYRMRGYSPYTNPSSDLGYAVLNETGDGAGHNKVSFEDKTYCRIYFSAVFDAAVYFDSRNGDVDYLNIVNLDIVYNRHLVDLRRKDCPHTIIETDEYNYSTDDISTYRFFRNGNKLGVMPSGFPSFIQVEEVIDIIRQTNKIKRVYRTDGKVVKF